MKSDYDQFDLLNRLVQDGYVKITRGSLGATSSSYAPIAYLEGLSSDPLKAQPLSGNLSSGVAPDVKTIGLDSSNTGVGLSVETGSAVIAGAFDAGASVVLIDSGGFTRTDFDFIARSVMGVSCVLSKQVVTTFEEAKNAVLLAASATMGCQVDVLVKHDHNHFVKSDRGNLGEALFILYQVLGSDYGINPISVYDNLFSDNSFDYDTDLLRIFKSDGDWGVGATATHFNIGRPFLAAAHRLNLQESLFAAAGCRLNCDFDPWPAVDFMSLDDFNGFNMWENGWDESETSSGGYLWLRGWPYQKPSGISTISRRVRPFVVMDRWGSPHPTAPFDYDFDNLTLIYKRLKLEDVNHIVQDVSEVFTCQKDAQ